MHPRRESHEIQLIKSGSNAVDTAVTRYGDTVLLCVRGIISPGMAVTSASSENKGSEWLAAYWAAMTHWSKKKAPDGERNHNDIWAAREREGAMARAATLHCCCKKVDGRLASEPNKALLY